MISHTRAREVVMRLIRGGMALASDEGAIIRYIEQQEAQSRRATKTRYYAGDTWAGETSSRRILSISDDRYTIAYESKGRRSTINMASWSEWVGTTKATLVERVP